MGKRDMRRGESGHRRLAYSRAVELGQRTIAAGIDLGERYAPRLGAYIQDYERRLPNALRLARVRLGSHRLALIVLFVACLAGQLATLIQTPLAVTFPDSGTYIQTATNLVVHHRLFNLQRTPGYPLFLAYIFVLTGGVNLRAVVFAQSLLMLLAAAEVYVLAFRLCRSRALATLAAALIGANLYILDWERCILSEACAVWVSVTIFLVFERCLRTNNRWYLAALLGLSAAAVMIRPMFVLLPLLLFVVLGLRMLTTRASAGRLRDVALALAAVYLVVCGYMAGNRVVNGYFTLSDVSNVNLFGKVLEYRLQNDTRDARYAQIQLDADTFSRTHNTANPYTFLGLYRGYSHPPFALIGAYANDVVLNNLPAFLRDSMPDTVTTWAAAPYVYAQWDAASPLVALLTEISLVGLGMELMLPLVLLLQGAVCWRERLSARSCVLLALTLGVVLNLVEIGTGSYGEFYRLRAPLDWIMILVGVLVVGDLLLRAAGRKGPLFASM